MSTIAAPPVWTVAAGLPFTTSLLAPAAPDLAGKPLGARVEIPVTRAIAAYWQPATLLPAVRDTPAYWSVTLDAAPEQPGGYQFVWRTSDDPATFEVMIPLVVTAELTPAWAAVDYPPVTADDVTPGVDEVAAIERDRTIDANDVDQGTFTTDTTPTDAEVEGLIATAAAAVMSEMRSEYAPAHYAQVKHLVRLYTAMLIEGSYYREQANNRADLWQNLFTTGLANLNAKIEQEFSQALTPFGMEPRQRLPNTTRLLA